MMGKVGLGVAVTAVALLALGCSSSSDAATKEAFASIDIVVDRVGVDRWGTVVADLRSGTAEQLGERATRRISIVTPGDPAAGLTNARAQIEAAGATTTGADAWSATQDGRRITLLLSALPAGATPPGASNPVPPGQAGLYLTAALSS